MRTLICRASDDRQELIVITKIEQGVVQRRTIPVLLEHLQRDHPEYVREPIARALAVPEASWAWDVLLSLFKQEPEGGVHNVKWALACALAGAATEDVVDELIQLVLDRSFGENRLAVLSVLANSREPRARRVLEDLRADPQLSRESRVLIGRPGPGRTPKT